MHVYICVNNSVGAACTPAGNTWLCCHHSGSCCECPCRLAERGDPLCGSPRRRGASCTSFVTPFGLLCLWLPCSSGPTWQPLCRRTSALSNLPVNRENNQQTLLSYSMLYALCTFAKQSIYTVRSIYLLKYIHILYIFLFLFSWLINLFLIIIIIITTVIRLYAVLATLLS